MPVSTSQLFKTVRTTGHGLWLKVTQLARRVLGLTPAQAPLAQPGEHPHSPDWSPPASGANLKALLTMAPLVDAPLRKFPPAPASANAPASAHAPAIPQSELKIALVPARPASFTKHVFQFAGEEYVYRLYLPGTSPAAQAPVLPLLVLLHGCKQDAADFSAGTAMNLLAEQRQCMVLYPEQPPKANQLRCWNWFETKHQSRGAGEPAMLAALTHKVLANYPADPDRVYVAGLSAGGAMAALVAGLYPELFAAVGVHSGLPSGAASGMFSALIAMRRGSRRTSGKAGKNEVMPTIVFHGSADTTVHPDNGDQVVAFALAGWRASGLVLEKSQRSEVGQRLTVRDMYSAADGKSYVELWSVSSGPHAWSGGKSAGSFTDPLGPSASLAMLNFFLRHHKSAVSHQRQGLPSQTR